MADRRRLSGTIVVLLVVGTLAGTVGATHGAGTAAETGQVRQVEETFQTHTFEGRVYLADVPSGPAPANGYPVDVMLHGCGQDPRGFDTATGIAPSTTSDGPRGGELRRGPPGADRRAQRLRLLELVPALELRTGGR